MNFGIESVVFSRAAERAVLAMEDPADAARRSCGMIVIASRTLGSARYSGSLPPKRSPRHRVEFSLKRGSWNLEVEIANGLGEGPSHK